MREECGLAFDIGTTTVEARLYRRTGTRGAYRVGEILEKNAQSRYGTDIISRIAFANKSETNRAQLQTAILTQIESLAGKLTGGSDFVVSAAVFTGNTAMLHFLTGRTTKHMAAAPFESASLFGFETTWGDICKTNYRQTVLPSGMPVFLPPCAGVFTGADLISEVTAISLQSAQAKTQHEFLLADIGTNCEMAFYSAPSNERFICAATAAGPAFEGGGIKYGMRATPGAICRVTREDDSFKVDSIQNKKPVGICGTGLVSAVACLLDAGIIDSSGLLLQGNEIALSGDIALTQHDIRNFQLAKGAVRAGLDIILTEARFSADKIPLYLCGAFGSSLDVRDAARLGLFPAQSAGQVIPAGNAALDGAALFLFSEEGRRRAKHLAHIAQSINLAEHPKFQNEFIGALNFQ